MKTTMASGNPNRADRNCNAVASVALVFLSALVHCSGQGTLQITFESPPAQAAGTFSVIGYYIESGVKFWNPHGPENLSLRGSSIGWAPDNETPNLFASGVLGFAMTNGMRFSLLSLDVAEDSIYRTFSRPFQAIGYRLGNPVVTNDFMIDGIVDGPGGAVDFQTFQFDPRFVDLDRIEIPSGGWGWSFDNLVLSIPEPSAGALMLGGLAALACSRIKLRRKWFVHQDRHPDR